MASPLSAKLLVNLGPSLSKLVLIIGAQKTRGSIRNASETTKALSMPNFCVTSKGKAATEAQYVKLYNA